jgi:glucose/arabinose dehydrogenase
MNWKSWLLLALALGAIAGRAPAQTIQTEAHTVKVTVLTEGLEFPWGLAFLPDGRMLVTERLGRLRVIEADGALRAPPLRGVPQVDAEDQGGLLDVALHPRFLENRLIYLSYSARGEGGRGTEVLRARLSEQAIEDGTVIFRLEPKSASPRHYGSRLLFDTEGLLYVTLGDRRAAARAQALDDHAGKIVRLRDDGTTPPDNPFSSSGTGRREIFTLGHRNVQGAALHPITRRIWISEHGEDTNDRVMVLAKGGNYGWPPGSRNPASVPPPVFAWTPTIAPSGLALYAGDKFPGWKGDAFLGSLKDGMLVRLKLEGERVLHEERLLQGMLGRIRDVRAGPDGLLYLLVDHRNGKLVRLEPAPG